MGLSETDRQEVVKFRLEKAWNVFAEISILLENKFYVTAANRLYYACYYAATALLIKDGYEIHTHAGIKILLGLHYIKKNKIDKSFGKTYNHLFNLRQSGDYEDLFNVEEQDITPLIEPAENFIKTIEQLILNDTENIMI